MNTEMSSEIIAGSLVGLKPTDKDPDVNERLRRWEHSYGRGPFKVRHVTDEHVSLEWIKDPLNRQKSGELVHFWSLNDSHISIRYVEPWVT